IARQQWLPGVSRRECRCPPLVEQHRCRQCRMTRLDGNRGFPEQAHIGAGLPELFAKPSGHVRCRRHATGDVYREATCTVGRVLEPLAEFTLAAAGLAHYEEEAIVGGERPAMDNPA